MADSPYKMLVLDLDGTALKWGNQLDPADIEAAKALQDAGVHVTIATGRLYGGTRWVAEALGVQGSVAVMNGSERISLADHERIHRAALPAPAMGLVRAVLADRGLSAFLFRSDGIDHDERDAQHAPYLGIWTPELNAHPELYGIPHWESDDTLAVGALGDHAAVQDAQAALEDALRSSGIDTVGMRRFDTFTGEHFMKIRDSRVDKGTAIAELAAERGLSVDQTVVVGDWTNDLPMLKAAGLSFAMGEAIDEVQAAADDVLESKRGEGGAVAEIAKRVFGV
jgi:Cof subfamily protein (haloacid dehalogenase superfamily)